MKSKRGKFSRIAESLGQRLQEGSSISVEDIHIINRQEAHEEKSMINCYPGKYIGKCCHVALFFSINGSDAIGPRYQGRGHIRLRHISFHHMMKEFYKHMNERCPRETREVGIFSNDWSTKEYDNYRNFIEGLRKRGVMIETYFISRGRSVLVDS